MANDGDLTHFLMRLFVVSLKENVGHCPNHEAPQAVARVASSWIEAKDRRRDQLQLVMNDKEVIHEPWGEIVIRETDENGIEVRAQRTAMEELRILISCL